MYNILFVNAATKSRDLQLYPELNKLIFYHVHYAIMSTEFFFKYISRKYLMQNIFQRCELNIFCQHH